MVAASGHAGICAGCNGNARRRPAGCIQRVTPVQSICSQKRLSCILTDFVIATGVVIVIVVIVFCNSGAVVCMRCERKSTSRIIEAAVL